MRYQSYEPSADLRDSVESFWTLWQGSGGAPPKSGTVLPDGGIELVLNHGTVCAPDGARLDSSFVVGQLATSQKLQYEGSVNLFGIRLLPPAAHSLLGLDLHELTDRIVDLASVSRRLADDLLRDVDPESSTGARIHAVECVLRRRIRQSPAADRLVLAVTSEIRRTHGTLKNDSLERIADLSIRQLERRFARVVGVSPKLLCRVARFQRVVQSVPPSRTVNWAALAIEAGYYDQSHLIRDFRRFTGFPPSAFFSGTS